MKKPIQSVQIVSDGIVVRFSDGVLTYFAEDFLREHIGTGSNQIFVDYEQSFDLETSHPALYPVQ